MSSLTIFYKEVHEKGGVQLSCKYNNSMYTIVPEEVDVCFDEFEQLLLSEDYESQEELNNRLNREYFSVYELNEQMLEFARAGDEYYGD